MIEDRYMRIFEQIIKRQDAIMDMLSSFMQVYAKDNNPEMFVNSLFPDKFKDIVTRCFLENNDSFQTPRNGKKHTRD